MKENKKRKRHTHAHTHTPEYINTPLSAFSNLVKSMFTFMA